MVCGRRAGRTDLSGAWRRHRMAGRGIFAVSLVLLFFTRPFVVKCVKPGRVRTNYESAIGKQVLIKEKVDNLAGTGTADLEGQEWTARMEDDAQTLEAGMRGEVVEISGVKLILRAVEAESQK